MRLVVLAWTALLACGCHDRAPRALARLAGEVHVHGFTGGFHPAALFVASPVPAERVDGDSLLAQEEPRAGGCALTSSSDVRPTPEVTQADAGPLSILGGRGVPRIELAFDKGSGYGWRGSLPHTEAFTGGELLTFDASGGAAPAFHGTLEAPALLELTAPAKLAVPSDGFTVRWKAARAERIVLQLVASRPDGKWAVIRCRADDAAGELTFPRALLRQLPPPPRDLQLEVSRNQIARVETQQPGTGVILHASFARKLTAHEE